MGAGAVPGSGSVGPKAGGVGRQWPAWGDDGALLVRVGGVGVGSGAIIVRSSAESRPGSRLVEVMGGAFSISLRRSGRQAYKTPLVAATNRTLFSKAGAATICEPTLPVSYNVCSPPRPAASAPYTRPSVAPKNSVPPDTTGAPRTGRSRP
jgi:hypothetical protein